MNNEVDKVVTEGVPYADTSNLIRVFSNAEYNSVEKAALEIIDNSVDAGAKNICVFLRTEFNKKIGKINLSKIAFLDDGKGMTPGVLQHVVAFGTTRSSKDKIGKFGIGLNQASLFACNTFSVYSWTSPDEVYLQKFDSKYIKENHIERAFPPEKAELPSYVKDSTIYQNFAKEHGTLVVWEDLERIKYKKNSTFINHLRPEIGKTYRYFINDDKLHIYIQDDDKAIEMVSAIDPLFLMEKTEVLGDKDGSSKLKRNGDGEPLFELFNNSYLLHNGIKSYEVPYQDGNEIKKSKVYLRASVIKEKFYYEAAIKDKIKNPGDTEIGQYVKIFEGGISVVRNKREIDFGLFDFYDNVNQPTNRWFKLEISFTSELDDVFNVSNNKQHVELKKIKDGKDVSYDPDDINFPIWLRLKDDIKTLVTQMRNRNTNLAKQKNKIEESIEIDKSKEIKKEDKIQTFDEVVSSLDDTKKIEIESPIVKDSSKKIDIIQSKNEYEDVIVNYLSELKNWYSWNYDCDTRKYIICFDKNKINWGRFNKDVEYLIVLTCKKLDTTIDHFSKKQLIELLDEFKEYLCNKGA